MHNLSFRTHQLLASCSVTGCMADYRWYSRNLQTYRHQPTRQGTCIATQKHCRISVHVLLSEPWLFLILRQSCQPLPACFHLQFPHGKSGGRHIPCSPNWLVFQSVLLSAYTACRSCLSKYRTISSVCPSISGRIPGVSTFQHFYSWCLSPCKYWWKYNFSSISA